MSEPAFETVERQERPAAGHAIAVVLLGAVSLGGVLYSLAHIDGAGFAAFGFAASAFVFGFAVLLLYMLLSDAWLRRAVQDSWRDNPTVTPPAWATSDIESPAGEPSDTGFHERGELADGTPVGRKGDLWYVLDENGAASSRSYHEIRVAKGGLVGVRGATTERVEYRSQSAMADELPARLVRVSQDAIEGGDLGPTRTSCPPRSTADPLRGYWCRYPSTDIHHLNNHDTLSDRVCVVVRSPSRR